MASVRRRPNGKYETRYYAGGRQRSATFATHDEAKNHGTLMEAAGLRGEWRDPRLGKVTFRAFATEWATAMQTRTDLAYNTRRAYTQALDSRLLPWWGERRMGSTERADVRAWARWAQGRFAASSVHTAYTVLRLIFDEAVERRIIAASPCVRPELPQVHQKEMTPLTMAQLDALATEVDAGASDYRFVRRPVARHGTAVLLAGYCGLRAGEVWGAHVGSVDFLRRELAVDWHLTDADGMLAASPCVRPELPPTHQKEMTPLTMAQLDALAAAVDAGASDYRFVRRPVARHGTAVLLAGYCGLRAGEVWGAHVGSVDFLRRELAVDWHLTDADGMLAMTPAAKGRKWRSVPIPTDVADALAAHLAARPAVEAMRGHRLVFSSAEGGPIRHNNWYRRHYLPAVRRLHDADATFPLVDFHDLRHTAVALWIDAGIGLSAISAWLGHSSEAFTARVYARLLPATHEREAAKLDAAVRLAKAAHKAKDRDSG